MPLFVPQAAPDTASHFGELLGVLYLHGEVVTHIFNYMDQVKQARDNIKENLLREARKMVERSIKEEDSELAKQGVTADILDDPDALRKLGIKMMFHDMDLVCASVCAHTRARATRRG